MNAFTLSGLHDLLKMGLSHGGEPNLEHPALSSASADGYVISHLHDVGGLCEVWFGFDQSTGRKIAIKCARLSEINADSAEILLRHEASVLTELRGAAGIEPLGVSGTGLSTYLLLPWIDGKPIDEAVAADPDQATRYIRAALNRLARVHAAGFIHGDPKPAHLVASGGDVLLLDFGLARSRDEKVHPSLAPRVAGKTPEFAPPDRLDDDLQHRDTQHDVYAMGAVLDTLTPCLSGTLALAVRRVVTLSRHRGTKDAGELLACFNRTVLRRRRRRQAAAIAASLITVAAAGVSAGIAVWPSVVDSRAAVPHAHTEREARALGPWSASFGLLDNHPDRATVLHRLDEIAIRGLADSDGTIAWLLHNNDIVLWSTEHGPRVVQLPQPNQLYAACWGDQGELLVVTRDGLVWMVTKDAVQQMTRLDRQSARLAAADGAVEGWSSHEARVVRATPDGVHVVNPGPVAATPIRGLGSVWVTVDTSTHEVILPGGVPSGIKLSRDEYITAAYGTPAGDLAMGLSTGDFLLRSGVGPLRRHDGLDRHTITSICITPDGGTVLIGGPAVYAYDVAHGKVVASRAPASRGVVFGLSIDASSGILTVVSNWSAESWQLIDQNPPLASRSSSF